MMFFTREFFAFAMAITCSDTFLTSSFVSKSDTQSSKFLLCITCTDHQWSQIYEHISSAQKITVPRAYPRTTRTEV